MKDQIIFDTTDAATIGDSDKILSGILSTDGSTLITDTLEGGKQGLDVYVINSSLTAATGAEKAEDAVHSSGDTGNFVLAVANHTEGALHSADGDYAALQVDSSGRLRVIADLDFTPNAEKAEDSAHSSGDIGNFILAVRQDTLASSTSADGDYAALKENSKGELYVIDTDGNALLTTIDAVLDTIKTDTAAMVVDLAAIEVEQLAQGVTLDAILVDTSSIDSTLTALSKAEDSVHGSGDQGIMALAVRNDAGTALAADGDYIPFSMDSSGALRVVDTSSGTDVALANTAIANAVNTMTVADTAEDVVASPLASRKYLYVYNNGNKRLFIGASGVTSSNGFPISPRAYMELRAGASIDIEWVAPDTAQEVRTMELS